MSRLRAIRLQVVALLVLVIGAPTVAQSPTPLPPDVIDQVSVVILQLQSPEGDTLSADQLAAAQAVVEARLAALPAGATLTLIPWDRLRIDLVDPSQLEAVTRAATAPGMFRIVGVPTEGAAAVAPDQPLPDGVEVHEVVAPGHIVHAAVGEDQLGQPALDLELDASAADALDAWAAGHPGEVIALVLDDIVVSAATLQAIQFHGRVQVGGSLDMQRIREVAAILTGGALPVLAEPLPDCLPAGCPVPSATPGTPTAP